MSEEQKPLNIYQRLNKVREAVAYIQKDDKLIAGKYKAVTHDAVTAAVREHLIAQGVMVVPCIEKSLVSDTKTTTAKGIPIIRYEATYLLAFINCDAPDEVVTVRVESHALDEGDKAPGKALSYAVKYAMLKLFSIETGEDDEERIKQRPKDLDAGGKMAYDIADANIRPTSGAFEALDTDMQTLVQDLATEAGGMLNKADVEGAYERIEEAGLDNEAKMGLWSLLDSKQRSALKKERERRVSKAD